ASGHLDVADRTFGQSFEQGGGGGGGCSRWGGHFHSHQVQCRVGAECVKGSGEVVGASGNGDHHVERAEVGFFSGEAGAWLAAASLGHEVGAHVGGVIRGAVFSVGGQCLFHGCVAGWEECRIVHQGVVQVCALCFALPPAQVHA